MNNKRSNIKTKHSEIVKYWSNKYIHSDGRVTEGRENDGMLLLIDIGEPECFICGMSPMSLPNFPLEKYEKIMSSDEYLTVWNMAKVKSVLDKAHIIPDSLGREDIPSNLMCLCKRCHKEAPNTNDYAAFIRYVYEEKSTSKFAQGISVDMLKRMYELMLESGISEEEIMQFKHDDYVKLFTPTDDFQMIAHFGDKINESTLFASFRKSIEEYLANKDERESNS